ncbi:anti-sigma factor antagonist [Patescibacteria group bacterium]|nr:anti-sigma factor antagonist [Patescibacteria group bacterium]MBU1682577.1 anti-sigma factor antagonist [Patescibacteria group bacterium]MBU1935732.1 anti-sigma factor antagonist [Patescibacteria group bacterium]
MPIVAQIKAELIENTYYVIHMTGEIDVNQLPVLESITKPLLEENNVKGFVINCSELTFIDSKIVGYIAYLYTTLTHSNKKLLIAGANDTINDILTLVGLNAIITFFPTVDEAIQSFNI